ncbi:MAG: response regulator [Rhodospirillales bacterium]|nr:response regulator [Alphaproteobacteria bacterium]MCB9986905.1 response regulator [Rhodospirillales bacterium]USO08317.1 MAG: response regulator [Rhodospirillales bacterium]
MNILIIDRDRDSCEHLRGLLEDEGRNRVAVEPIKNSAIELIRKEDFDVIFYDPVPQNEMRSFIVGVRRSTGAFPPFVLITHNLTRAQALAAGGNAILQKPIDDAKALKAARDAASISKISRLMADESEDFPSKNGIIAKSAFNQLWITSLDRADRHGEESFFIFIEVENLDQIAAKDGAEAAAEVAGNLRKTISRTRRTSDIAGHIRSAQFCLLLSRPSREDEPFLAANRFAESLKENHDLISTTPTRAILKISLLSVPSGETPIEHIVGRDS